MLKTPECSRWRAGRSSIATHSVPGYFLAGPADRALHLCATHAEEYNMLHPINPQAVPAAAKKRKR